MKKDVPSMNQVGFARRRPRISAAGAAALCAVAVAGVTGVVASGGCGGGNSPSASPSSSSATGRVRVTMLWPSEGPTRLIPRRAQSVNLEFFLAGNTQQAFQNEIFVKQGGGQVNNITQKYVTLPAGNLTLRATAFPNADATGTAQAGGTVPLTVVAGQDTPVTLTMDTAISRIDVTPPGPVVFQVGDQRTFIATARDFLNNVVLVTAGKWQWSGNVGAETNFGLSVYSSEQDSQATVTAFGTAGDTPLTVEETESGKKATVTISSELSLGEGF